MIFLEFMGGDFRGLEETENENPPARSVPSLARAVVAVFACMIWRMNKKHRTKHHPVFFISFPGENAFLRRWAAGV